MRYPVGVQEQASRQWMADAAKEFNLSRFEPIIGTDGATWDVATVNSAAPIESTTFNIVQPGARVSFDLTFNMDSDCASSGAGDWLVRMDMQIDSESRTDLKVYCRVSDTEAGAGGTRSCSGSIKRTLDLAPGVHTVDIWAQTSGVINAGTIGYHYRIEAFYRTLNTIKV